MYIYLYIYTLSLLSKIIDAFYHIQIQISHFVREGGRIERSRGMKAVEEEIFLNPKKLKLINDKALIVLLILYI